MTSRREFLKVGLIATALPVGAHAEAFATAAPAPDRVPLYKVLYDTRFAASVAFGRRAAAHGAAVHAMNGDVTGFWYDDLYHRWREQPAAIAGLTAHGALFCLERLAWDQRLRVVFRGEHAATADGAVTHRFEGSLELVTAAVHGLSARAWHAALADAVVQGPRGCAARESRSALTASAEGMPPAEGLWSWVIAGVPRA